VPALPLLDESSYGHYLRPAGGATASSSAGRYGTAGMPFNGTSQHHLAPNHPGFLLPQRFTLEADVASVSAIPGGREACILSVWHPAGISWFFGLNSSRQVTFYTSTDGGSGVFSKVTPVNSFPASGYAHLAVTRDASNVLRMFVEGALVYSTTDTGTYFASAADLGVGIHAGLDANSRLHEANVDNVRITNDVCRYSAAFTPPGSLPVGGDDPNWANVTLLLRGATRNLTYKQTPSTSFFRPGEGPSAASKLSRLGALLQDTAYGGDGRVAGTVKVKGAPDYAVYRRVRLIRERDGVFIRETWSHPVTGAYVFDGVDRTQKYTVLSYDHTFNFRAVVADNLTPEVMP
jgi:hypothetical protein